MLCKLCDGLSIKCLLELAKVEFRPKELTFPQKAYYKHHSSYEDLVQSAQAGCELCDFIYYAIKEISLSSGVLVANISKEATLHDVATTTSEISDLRICIETDVWDCHEISLQDCRLLDKIRIQVGQSFEDFEDYDEGYDQSLPSVELISFTPQGEEKYIEGHQIGRCRLDPDLGSSANYNIARNWMRECSEHHESCSKKRHFVMPTRVIDVGDIDGPLLPCLVLSLGATGEYTALSHCWGGPISPLLKNENIESFQTGIDFDNLPANFRDAISITRQLGVRYLWIDSLCILQDCEEDWERESSQMGAVYRDSSLTISASASHGSTNGILKTAQEEPERTASIKLFPDSKEMDSVGVALKTTQNDDFWSLYLQGPLNSRGWVFQESLLPSRILHYGSRQIYWQCREVFEGADRVNLNTQLLDIQHREMRALLNSSLANGLALDEIDSERMRAFYYDLVDDYCDRNLSDPSDKLPAFSALARVVHPVFGGDYLAGIWSTDFRHGLCWYKEMATCRHATAYRAPSWSWASTTEELVFSSYQKPTRVGREVSMISNSIELKYSNNPYGQVKSAELVLKGLTKRLYRSSQVINSKIDTIDKVAGIYYDEGLPGLDNNEGTVLAIVGRDGERYDRLLSIVTSLDGPDDENLVPSLISKQHYELLVIETFDANEERKFMADCLVLVKMDSLEDVYKRVGYARMGVQWTQSEDCMDSIDFLDLIKPWESKILRLI